MADKKQTEKKNAKKKSVPVSEKTTMNFARRESSFNVKKMTPIIIVLAVVVVLFLKFGILDQVNKKVDAYADLAAKQTQIDEMETKLAGYNELYAKYGRYSYGWMDESEVSTIDRMNILKLLEDKVMPSAQIKDVSINGDIITMNLTNVTLQETSAIVKVLEQDDLVKSASVYSATADDGARAEIFMSVVLDNGVEEVPEEAGEADTNE